MELRRIRARKNGIIRENSLSELQKALLIKDDLYLLALFAEDFFVCIGLNENPIIVYSKEAFAHDDIMEIIENYPVDEKYSARLIEYDEFLKKHNAKTTAITNPQPSPDPVNHPSHYNQGKIEVIEYIEDQSLGFNLGNAVKYISRAGKKDAAKTKEDLLKAIWYLKREIELLKPPTERKRPNEMNK